jgi:hypothetical protein
MHGRGQGRGQGKAGVQEHVESPNLPQHAYCCAVLIRKPFFGPRVWRQQRWHPLCLQTICLLLCSLCSMVCCAVQT